SRSWQDAWMLFCETPFGFSNAHVQSLLGWHDSPTIRCQQFVNNPVAESRLCCSAITARARGNPSGKRLDDSLVFVAKPLRHAAFVTFQVFADAAEFGAPAFAVEAEKHIPRLLRQGQPVEVEFVRFR